MKNLVEYAWFEAGYTKGHPGCFKSSNQAIFSEELGNGLRGFLGIYPRIETAHTVSCTLFLFIIGGSGQVKSFSEVTVNKLEWSTDKQKEDLLKRSLKEACVLQAVM